MKVTLVPRTKGGWVSLAGLAGFVFFLSLFYLLAAIVPPTDVEGFFGQPHLAASLLAAWASASVGLLFGAHALIVRRDLSGLVLLAVLIGAFVEFWAIAANLGG